MNRDYLHPAAAVTQAELEAKLAEAHRLRAETIAAGFRSLGAAFDRLLHPGRARTA